MTAAPGADVATTYPLGAKDTYEFQWSGILHSGNFEFARNSEVRKIEFVRKWETGFLRSYVFSPFVDLMLYSSREAFLIHRYA